MNQLKSLTLGLLASSVLVANFTYWAPISKAEPAPPPGGHPSAMSEECGPDGADKDCPMECSREAWPEKLDLSDEQMEKLVSLKSDYELKTAEQNAQLKADMRQLVLALTAPRTDRDTVLALNKKISGTRADLATARINHLLSVMEVMDPKQKEQIRHHILVNMLSHPGMHRMHHHWFEHH